MKSLLFLCHRIPYPPNKGDKIRSYHLLKYLSKEYKVHLGAFVDDPNDFQHEDKIAALCTSHCLLPLNPALGKLKALSGFVKGSALGLPYFFNRKMQRWVDGVVATEGIETVLVFSSTMAQYVVGARYRHLRRYIDFIDIDSDKWAQYKAYASPWMRRVYAYEAQKLFMWERRLATEFEHGFFVSDKEVELFTEMVPEAKGRVSSLNNGVDTDYFSPHRAYPSPYPEGERAIVFTGVMDCWTNVDAVTWFARQVLPGVISDIPNVKFYIVGARPNKGVQALAASSHVEVVGAVGDVRPYLAHASIAVAPMRVARGVQNKVLEAMAMGRPVICSPLGYEGIVAEPDKALMLADGVSEWRGRIADILLGPSGEALGHAARECMLGDNYRWQRNLEQLKHYLDGPGKDDRYD